MADAEISELTALTEPRSGDLLPVVDTSATETKSVEFLLAIGHVYNVKHYGAAGDNTGDDGPEIQAAIDAANAADGGIVYFPPGKYRIQTAIDLKEGVTLVGAGRSANEDYGTTLNISGVTGEGITCKGSEGSLRIGCGVRDLKIRGNTNLTAGISLQWAGRFQCFNVEIVNVANGPALKIADQVQDCDFSYLRIADPAASANGAIEITTASTTNVANANYWNRITFENLDTAAFYVRGNSSQTVTQLIITGIKCEVIGSDYAATHQCFDFQYASKVMISEATIRMRKHNGTNYYDHAVFKFDECSVIKLNDIDCAWTGSNSHNHIGVILDDSDQFMISGYTELRPDWSEVILESGTVTHNISAGEYPGIFQYAVGSGRDTDPTGKTASGNWYTSGTPGAA